MINRFSQFLVEEEKTVYFTFGRLNPPTAGHEMLLNKLAKAAGKNQYRIYLSKSNDPKKNPLTYNEKIKFARKMFPKHARQIIKDPSITTVMNIATKLYEDGFVNVVMAVDGPRSREFDILLNKYNGVKAKHGFYNFKSIKFINVGERNDASADIDGVSATKQRNAAANNDFTLFAQGLPKNVSNKDARDLFNAVRRGMGLKEEKTFKNHVQLEPVSAIREAYVKDGLFNEGDEVVMLKNERVGKIKHLGANYVIVESKGETWRCWLNDVAKVDEKTDQYGHMNVDYDVADYGATPEGGPYKILSEGTDKWYKDQPEWGTPESTAKAKKKTPGEQQEAKDTHKTKDGKTAKKGLWYNIHKRREKGLPPKKPGQKGYPKTLNIERTMDQVQDIISKDKQDMAKDKEAMKLKHDRMMDRARRSRMLMKNKGIKS